MERYYKRIIEDNIKFRLQSKGAVLIEGAKWCGKTTTAKHLSGSVLKVDAPQNLEKYKIISETNPASLLEGDSPRLIAEWQLIPNIWNTVRYEVDERDKFGQFILTGSVLPIELSEGTHSGIGRIVKLTMRTMSLYESKDSSGVISLASLFNGEEVYGESHHQIDDISYLICRGGWPKAIGVQKKIALQQAVDYYDSLVKDNRVQVKELISSEKKLSKVMKSYARNIASQASLETIRRDVDGNEKMFSQMSLYKYLNYLRQIFVIDDVGAWSANTRSKAAIRQCETRYFVDPSIATAALGLSPENLLNDINTLGLLFENMVIRDLKIYAESIDGEVLHYRDKNGLECDAIIQLKNGDYGLIEIKLGGKSLIEQGIKSLNKLESILDFESMNKPKFKAVICGISSFAYKTQDGTYVIPIGCLKN